MNKAHAKLHKVLARDGWRCRYCGRKLFCRACEPARVRTEHAAIWATRDHVFPRARGGTGAFDNLAAACPPCNTHKGDTLPGDYVPQLVRQPTSKAVRRALTNRAVWVAPARRTHSPGCWVARLHGQPDGAIWWCNC